MMTLAVTEGALGPTPCAQPRGAGLPTEGSRPKFLGEPYAPADASGPSRRAQWPFSTTYGRMLDQATCAAALAGEDSVGHGSAAQAVGTPSTCMVGMWVDESAQPRTERLWLHRSVSLRGGTPPVVCIGSGII